MPPVVTPLYTPSQKLIYPFTTPLIVLVSIGKFFEESSVFGITEMSYWIMWICFGTVSVIVLLVFYNDGKYKSTPRQVQSCDSSST